MTSNVVPADDDLVERVAREIESYGEGLVPELRIVTNWLAVYFRRDDVRSELTASLSSELARCRNALEPFAKGSIDVSGSAVILGYPEAKKALAAARAALNPIGEEGAREP